MCCYWGMANESYLLQQIRETNKAISDLKTGAQSASVSTLGGSRSYTRANLAALIEERDQLIRRFNMADMRKRTAPSFVTRSESE